MLGVVLAALSAATFAFNNASARRGVLTGSVAQALAITVPIGVPMFLRRRDYHRQSRRVVAFFRRSDGPAGARRRAAFRGGTLRQFPRRPGDRRQPVGTGDPAQPRRYPGAGGAGAERADDAAAHPGDRVARAGARTHAQCHSRGDARRTARDARACRNSSRATPRATPFRSWRRWSTGSRRC